MVNIPPIYIYIYIYGDEWGMGCYCYTHIAHVALTKTCNYILSTHIYIIAHDLYILYVYMHLFFASTDAYTHHTLISIDAHG